MLRTASELAALRAEASAVRVAWLAAVSDGVMTPDDLLRFAATPRGRALRKVRLDDLLKATPGLSNRQVRSTMARLRMVCHVSPDKTLTVMWLLDARYGRPRARAWAVLSAQARTVAPGWPFVGAVR